MKSTGKVSTDKEVANRILKLSQRAVAKKPGRSYAEEAAEADKKQLSTPTQLKELSNLASSREDAASTILKTTPDTARAIGILTGMAVCPAGGTRAKLNFLCGRNGTIPDETGNITRIHEELYDFFSNTLDIESNQYSKLYDILSVKGAVVTAIIPDSKLDGVINESEDGKGIALESLYRQSVISKNTFENGVMTLPHLGILGDTTTNKKEAALESAFNTGLQRQSYNSALIKNGTNVLVDVIDNPDVLKFPTLIEMNNNARQSLAIEAYNSSKGLLRSSSKLHPNFTLKRKYKVSPLVALTDGERYSGKGRPQLLDIPANVFLPVYYPNNPERRYGGFVLLDECGNPLTIRTGDDAYQQLISGAGSNEADNQLTKIHNMTIGGTGHELKNIDKANQYNFKVFQEHLEKDLRQRLENGVGSGNYTLANDDIFYRIMLARALEHKRTRVLFLPDSMVCYAAVEYDEHGMGISLVAKNRLIATLRTILFYSNFMNALSNSLNKKVATVRLDPNDKNASKTIEKVMENLVESQAGISDTLRANGPTNIIEAIQKISMSVNIEDSEIAGLPKTKVTLEDEKRNVQPIDNDFMDELRKLQMMDYSISPEIIDSSFTPQFAAQVYRENDITARMVSEIVDAVARYNTEFVSKYVHHDPELVTSLLEVVEIKKLKKEDKEGIEEIEIDGDKNDHTVKGMDDYEQRLGWVERALEVLWVMPPGPEMDGMEHNSEDFGKFKALLDEVIDSKLNDNYGRGLSGDMSTAFELLRAALKQRYINSYLRRSNMLPELRSELTNEEDFQATLKDEIENLGILKPVLIDAVKKLAELTTSAERENRLTEEEINKEFDDRQREIEEAEAEAQQAADGIEEPNEDEEIISSDETVTDEETPEIDEGGVEGDEEAPEPTTEPTTEETPAETGGDEGGDLDLDMDAFTI